MVICQASKKEDWSDDIKDNTDMDACILGNGKVKDQKMIDNFTNGAMVVNYETVWRRDIKIDSSWLIIVDESQYLKNHKSKIGKWGAKASRLAGGVLLLSGTPMNKYEDLYNQMVMLGMDMPYAEFEGRFLITRLYKMPGSRWPTTLITGYRNTDLLLKGLATQSVTMKTEDAIDLPKQTFIDKHLIHDNIKIYQKVKKLQMYKEDVFPNPGITFLRLREYSSGYISEYKELSKHKVTAFKELLESNENNFFVFYNFNQELLDMKRICEELKIKVFEFNGATKNGYDSKNYEGRFIVAGQYQSAAEGLNMQHIQNMIYYSPPTSFIKWKQSLARIHRIGQDRPVFYYKLITKNTIEEKMYKALARGKDYDEKVFSKEN